MSEPVEEVEAEVVEEDSGNNRPQDPNETQDIRFIPEEEDEDEETDGEEEVVDPEPEPEAAVEEEAAPAPDDLAEFRDA
jgi:hypothetical protein